MTIINRNWKQFLLVLAPFIMSAYMAYTLFDSKLSIDSVQWGDNPWIFTTIVLLFHPINWIATYKYLQIDGKSIILRRSLFKIVELNIDQVEAINIEFSPFSSSYFSLKDGDKIKFDAWSIPKKEMDKLKLITSNIT